MASSQTPDLTDEELLLRARDGDKESFGELVRRYEKWLYHYLYRYTGDAELAADVFQQAFTRLYLSMDRYQPGRSVVAWLCQIATNQAIDALRYRQRQPDQTGTSLSSIAAGHDLTLSQVAEQCFTDRETNPVEAAEQAELRERLQAALSQLSEPYRVVLVLAYMQGLTHREIAETLEIPLGTVKSRMTVALARLTEIWHKQFSLAR